MKNIFGRGVVQFRGQLKTKNIKWIQKYISLFHVWIIFFSFFRGLLSSVQHCADWVSSTEKQEPIQKCFRSLEYIFKFIIHSRLLFSQSTGGLYEDNFRRDLLLVFSALNKMLTVTYDVILPTQVIFFFLFSLILKFDSKNLEI